MDNQIFISVNEAAKRLSCGITLIYEHIGKAASRTVKLGKKRLIDVESLNSFTSSLQDASGRESDRDHDPYSIRRRHDHSQRTHADVYTIKRN